MHKLLIVVLVGLLAACAKVPRDRLDDDIGRVYPGCRADSAGRARPVLPSRDDILYVKFIYTCADGTGGISAFQYSSQRGLLGSVFRFQYELPLWQVEQLE
jgi:hypothetical protein